MNDPAPAPAWSALLETAESIAALGVPSTEGVAACLSEAGLELIFDVRAGIVVLELPEGSDRADLATAVAGLGPAVGLDVVSPPVAGAGGAPGWDSKRSEGHEIAGRRVWFGIETADGVERLVSISIHFDGPPAEHLPPEGREGPFRVTTSLGWCGGFGEAVLDGTGAIRRHDDRPVYVDGAVQDEILERVDLSGSFAGEPVIRVAGRGRLERRTEVNPSIPGGEERGYVALVICELGEARIEGERAGNS
ncbi:MAG: hypothetical protein ABFS86_15750 [Planctomycetota bacterium]